MNTLKKLMLIALVLLVQAYAGSVSASLGYLRVSLIENELQIKSPEAGEWGYAAINSPLDVGDELWVPAGGRAELQLNTGTYLRLDGNTALQILSLDQDSSQFYLAQGRVYVFYDAPRGNVIQVDTPEAATRSFDRASFGVGVVAQYTDVAVYKGYVLTENRIGEIRVNAGHQVSLGADTNGAIDSLRTLDDWERWNQARDGRFAEIGDSESERYLPSELRSYSSDLDYHGRWVRVHEYGHVWTPRTHIGPRWTPYREGRWIWRHGEYIWVPYEPWGWVPCHYGRWAFVSGLGWVWVPPQPGHVYWGPGYVGWIRTPEYVGWVPLAPGEIYYGRGYYGPDSFNITDVHRDRIRPGHRYKNMEVGDAPVIVEQRTFHEGTRPLEIDKNIRDRMLVPENMIPGAPDIKPGRKSYFVVDRDLTEDKLPPRPIRIGDAMEQGKKRPLVREPGGSVFRPGIEPGGRPLPKVPPTGREEGMVPPPRAVPLPAPQEKGRGPEGGWDSSPGKRPVTPEQPGMKPRTIRPEETPGMPGGVEPLPAPQEKGDVSEGGRGRGGEKRPALPEQPGMTPKKRYVPEEVPGEQGRPVPLPDQGRKNKEQIPPPQAVQPVQPHPSQPVQPRVIQQPPQPRPVQPKAVQPPPQPRPVQPKAVQPPPQPQPVQPKANQPPPAVPEEGRKPKEQKKGQPAEAPQCGPGQKDQFDPAKCPQIVPNKMR